MEPVVLVTGCSSGIGRACALRLARSGAHVVATARRVEDIAALASPQVSVQPLDVTDPTQRRDAVDAVLQRHGRIDALVNNAGYGVMTAFEDTSSDSLRSMFEVNLFGLHELTRQVLPSMRRRGTGRIVNISSIAGRVSVPLMGGYCATKSAVRAVTQALHNEVRPFGLHACLVEPGVVKTGFGDRSRKELEAALPEPDQSPYAAMYRRWLERPRGHGADPETIAKAVAHACLAPRPRFHYIAPLHARLADVAARVLPDAALNAAYQAWFRRQAGGKGSDGQRR